MCMYEMSFFLQTCLMTSSSNGADGDKLIKLHVILMALTQNNLGNRKEDNKH